MYGKILAAIDGHLNSDIAARYALHLASACRARVYLCYVTDENTSPALFDRAEESLKRLFRDAQGMKIEVEAVIRCGNPLVVLKQFLSQEDIDLVFASAFGHETAGHVILGSVARGLISS